MKDGGRIAWLGLGLVLGALGAWGYFHAARPALAANDRHESRVHLIAPFFRPFEPPVDFVADLAAKPPFSDDDFGVGD